MENQVVESIPCTFAKPYINGHFGSMLDGWITELNKDVANCICSRYYKGIGGIGDNVVISVFKEI